MTTSPAVIPEPLRDDVETLWDYHDLHHQLHPADVGIGLGSHDPGVAIAAVNLYHSGLFPLLVFTGANAPTTLDKYPRGEAVHYAEYAIEHGVPADSVLVEPSATNTGQNLQFTSQLLAEHGIEVESAILVSRPYQQRRAFATAKKLWPDLDVQCTSYPLALDEYVAMIGDPKRVIDMLVGDTQRITVHAERGFAIPQPVPPVVAAAYRRLTQAGFTSRLL